MNKNYKLFSLLFLAFAFLFQSCVFFESKSIPQSEITEIIKPKTLWTFIIYMAGDNELSSVLIDDLNELEAANAVSEKLQIYALVDYAGNGATNYNAGTFLYKIKNDINDSSQILSEKIQCSSLGLSLEENASEKNLADKNVLENLIDFVKQESPSEEFGLIMWGHGTGYRNGNIQSGKGLAVDDNSEDFMSIVDFGEAVRDKGLSIIGFDTCFGMLLETVYEIKNDGKYFIGSSGLVPVSGWDYKTLFRDFSEKLHSSEDLSQDFCKIAKNQFVNQYSNEDKIEISYVDLSRVGDIYNGFEAFAKKLSERIVDIGSQAKIFETIFYEVKSYCGNTSPTDMYLDLYSFAEKMLEYGFEEGEILKALLQESGEKLNMGVHFIPLLYSNVTAERHGSSYIKNEETYNIKKLKFVEENQFWVPSLPPSNSVLDKLFYTNY